MTETSLLQGEVTENPHEQELDVEGLLLRFVRALVAEQKLPDSAASNRVIPPSIGSPAELAELQHTAELALKRTADAATTPKPVIAAAAGGATSTAPAAVESARILSLVRPLALPTKSPSTTHPIGDRS